MPHSFVDARTLMGLMLEVLWILDQMTSEKKKPLIGEPFMKLNFNMQKISLFHPEKAQSCQTMHLHCCWKISTI
jgi:hypothetical protein